MRQLKPHSHGLRGATGTGYGLVVGLIGIVAIGVVTTTGDSVKSLFVDVGDNLQTASTGDAPTGPAAQPTPEPSPTPVAVSGALTTADPGEWADGSHATSCDEYLNPTNTTHDPATSSGVYTIDIDGADGGDAPFNVYCDQVTDGGGWTRVTYNDTSSRQTSTGQIGNVTDLANGSGNNKLPDTTIRSLALAGSLEYMVRDSGSSGSTYIMRSDAAEWGAYATNGWRYNQYDAKNSSGVWIANACNGWADNRGFSTYGGTQICQTVFSGPVRYMYQYHTASCCATTAGHNIDGYVR